MRISWLLEVKCLVAWFVGSGLLSAVGGERAELPPPNPTSSRSDGIAPMPVSGERALVGGTEALHPLAKPQQTQLKNSPKIKVLPNRGVKVRAKDLLRTDPDGRVPTLSTTSITSAKGGKVALSEGWIAYQPPPGLSDADSFEVSVDDGRGGKRAGIVTVEVADEPGSSSNLVSSVREDGSVLIRGSGIPGRTYELQFALGSATTGWQPLGRVTADANGAWEYVDNPPPGSGPRNYRMQAD